MRSTCQPLAGLCLLNGQLLPATKQRHAFANHDLLDHLCRIAVFVRHDAVHGLNEVHLTAKPGECLCQLTTDGSCSDDRQPRRQLGQRKDSFVSQIARLL